MNKVEDAPGKIVIFYETNPQDARMLAIALADYTLSTTVFRISDPLPATIAMDLLSWGEMDFSSVALICIFDWTESVPTIPAADPPGSWSCWRDDYVCLEQKHSFFRSFLAEAERRGIMVLNSGNKTFDIFQCPHLLHKLKSAKLPVTDFIVTNEAREVAEFLGGNTGLWRACAGPSPWQYIDAAIAEAVVVGIPKIVTYSYPGEWVLLFSIFGRTLAILAVNPPRTEYPERLEAFSFWTEDEESSQFCQAVAEITGLDFVGIHGTFTQDGFRLFEIESSPLISHLPPQISAILFSRLAQTICEKITGHPPQPYTAALPAENERTYPRATIFLRRMLQELFDVERRRYRRSKSYGR